MTDDEFKRLIEDSADETRRHFDVVAEFDRRLRSLEERVERLESRPAN
jgi:hypothetical protein